MWKTKIISKFSAKLSMASYFVGMVNKLRIWNSSIKKKGPSPNYSINAPEFMAIFRKLIHGLPPL